MSGSMAPYRHTDVVHVVECESCERARVRAAELDAHVQRNRAIRSAAIKSTLGAAFTFAPWSYGGWLAAKWLVLTYPAAPVWAVFLVTMIIVGEVVLVVGAKHRVKTAIKAARGE